MGVVAKKRGNWMTSKDTFQAFPEELHILLHESWRQSSTPKKNMCDLLNAFHEKNEQKDGDTAF